MPPSWKVSVLLGLGLTFLGPILMIEARTLRQKGQVFYGTHACLHPWHNRFGWIFTIIGYCFQIAGVLLS